MYALAKEIRIAEVIDARRAYRDFLYVIERTAPILAKTRELLIETDTDHEAQLIKAIEAFRHDIRLEEAKNEKLSASASHSAFAVDKSRDSNRSNTPSFRGERQTPPPCLCGVEH